MNKIEYLKCGWSGMESDLVDIKAMGENDAIMSNVMVCPNCHIQAHETIDQPPPTPKRMDDGSYDQKEIDDYLAYFGSFGSQLAALRKTETKKCDNCGAEFTGLVRKVTCNKCLNTAKKNRYRDKLKTKNKVK